MEADTGAGDGGGEPSESLVGVCASAERASVSPSSSFSVQELSGSPGGS